ncbi:MAG: hypothetical protein RL885_15585 [Planctomycetota bacterium]
MIHDDFEDTLPVKTPDPQAHYEPGDHFGWQHWLVVVFMAFLLSGAIVFVIAAADHDSTRSETGAAEESQPAAK